MWNKITILCNSYNNVSNAIHLPYCLEILEERNDIRYNID